MERKRGENFLYLFFGGGQGEDFLRRAKVFFSPVTRVVDEFLTSGAKTWS